MKEHRHLGSYGLVISNDEILLIKKHGGPYDGLLDLPGGSIEYLERPADALKRELAEEVGIEVINYELFDVDSVEAVWKESKENTFLVHHIGIFYKVLNYKNNIKKEVEITDINDDSMGADFYKISNLKESDLSKIAILELKKLGYNLKK